MSRIPATNAQRSMRGMKKKKKCEQLIGRVSWLCLQNEIERCENRRQHFTKNNSRAEDDRQSCDWLVILPSQIVHANNEERRERALKIFHYGLHGHIMARRRIMLPDLPYSQIAGAIWWRRFCHWIPHAGAIVQFRQLASTSPWQTWRWIACARSNWSRARNNVHATTTQHKCTDGH